ncbi:hypothetical protein EVAR_91038_1 [Eumeta japonica]|uniref:Uncharacterized protein n=1 Tax=Eumeta variegata TaxID=151549 RepID=A0A4C1T572_EUMVA|nr:hypothetical protein EVAR_91038_1 [Eumeta japonica]
MYLRVCKGSFRLFSRFLFGMPHLWKALEGRKGAGSKLHKVSVFHYNISSKLHLSLGMPGIVIRQRTTNRQPVTSHDTVSRSSDEMLDEARGNEMPSSQKYQVNVIIMFLMPQLLAQDRERNKMIICQMNKF